MDICAANGAETAGHEYRAIHLREFGESCSGEGGVKDKAALTDGIYFGGVTGGTGVTKDYETASLGDTDCVECRSGSRFRRLPFSDVA